MLVLNLPLPPSVNHYWGTHGHRRFVSKAGKEFKLAVQDYVIENRVPKLGEKRLQMQVTLYPRDKRKQDIDKIAVKLHVAVHHPAFILRKGGTNSLEYKRTLLNLQHFISKL